MVAENDSRKDYILKSDLPKSFGVCFKFMIFFAIGTIVLFVLSHSIKGLSENSRFILQVSPFVFLAVAVIFSIALAGILLGSYLKRNHMINELIEGKFFRYLIVYAAISIAIYVLLIVPDLDTYWRLHLILYVNLVQFIVTIRALSDLRKKKNKDEVE
jgi:cyanate permease